MAGDISFSLKAEYSDLDDAVTIFVRIRGSFGEIAGQACGLFIGEIHVLDIALPNDSSTEAVAEARFGLGKILKENRYGIELKTKSDIDIFTYFEPKIEGDILEALRIESEDQYFDRVQLNFSRFAAPRILELAARAAYIRFEGHFLVQASALTVFSHRLLGRDPRGVARDERDQILWLMAGARPLVRRGAELIDAAGDRPDWRHVRWTVSLATVCGYLALYLEDYESSEAFFSIVRKYTHLVYISKVSALNFICGCFMHGIISHFVGNHEEAKISLTAGVERVRDCVAAQNMMENVWVLGDLISVVAAGHQCFIALARFGLLPPRDGSPIIDETAQIRSAAIKAPLRGMLQAGIAPALREHLARYGGS